MEKINTATSFPLLFFQGIDLPLVNIVIKMIVHIHNSDTHKRLMNEQ